MIGSLKRRGFVSLTAGAMGLVLCGATQAQAAVRSLTSEQVGSFAAVVTETEDDVAATLFRHPELIPVIAAAADARLARKRTGKTLTTVGFTILGVGLAVAIYTALSAPLICFDQACRQRQDDASATSKGIAIGGAVVGLALALPGFVTMAKESESEVEAVRRYRAVRPEPALPPLREPSRPQVGLAPRSLTVSLLSLRF